MYAWGPVTNGASDLERQRALAFHRLGQTEPSSSSLPNSSVHPTAPPHKPSVSLFTPESSTDKELITYIFPDFKAVTYFQKEFLALNEFHVAEESMATGFEIYLVEHWIRDRRIGGVVSAYTGNLEAKVQVVRFTTVKKPSRHYPARFQEYLNEAMMNHATFKRMEPRRKSTASGLHSETATPEFLLVTNTAALPSNLNLLPVPEGDTRVVEERFKINSNLKRLNCGGRSSSLLATKISDASCDKFRQMYRLHNESVPIQFAIEELVNIIQTCLFYFDLLDARYCDGLLCQKTEDAINSWWNLIGLPHFNSKQNVKNGILPSKTVAAIISLILSIRLRLNLFGGCDVPKDPFDYENFMLSIGHFQKQVKIEKRRKLDLHTLLKLFQLTRQDYSVDSTKSFGDDPYPYENNDLSHFESSQNLPGTGLQFAHGSPAANTPASTYKRNKMYYSKELKKFTNVVKNTVQDHIIIREDDDDFFDASKPTSGRIRKKLASKLGENVSPSDIETLDLDLLVRKYLTGKTLVRLWRGLGSAGDSLRNDPYLVGRRSRPQSGKLNDKTSDIYPNEGSLKQYKVVTLKDALLRNQDSMIASNVSDKSLDRSGKLGRMRFAFQNKKSPMPLKSDFGSDVDKISSHDPLYKESLLDAELKRMAADSGGSSPKASLDEQASSIAEEQDIRGHLNRRNSFPMTGRGDELNLNSLEYLRTENLASFAGITRRQHDQVLRRCASSSVIEMVNHTANDLKTEAYACYKFVDQITQMTKLQRVKNGACRKQNLDLKQRYKQLNLELVKLNNVHTQMQQRQAVFHTDYSAIFVAKMRDITDNIDRMAFRSRDLFKKINELDENSKKFEFQLRLQSLRRLNDISHHLMVSPKFQKVFKDEDERQQLSFLLAGSTQVPDNCKDLLKGWCGFRVLLMYIYEFIVVVLQMFNFDRSKMNLDRIRGVYRKIDPQRKYINSVYRMVGRDPSRYDGNDDNEEGGDSGAVSNKSE